MALDIIIKNGLVFDGLGNEPQKVDIGIKDDEIKKIGNLQTEKGESVIDAEGQYVCPGFIDITNHSDTHWTLFTHPRQESLIRQGITTILGGNCGVSLAPLTKEGMKYLERWADASAVNINWQTMEELFSEIEKRKIILNFASLVGLGNLITEEKDLEKTALLLKKSLEDGAFGISTSLGTRQGEFFSREDLIGLFKIVSKYNGITKHHLEDEGENILPSLSKIIQLGRDAGVRVHISHFKVLGRKSWGFFDNALNMMRNARSEGLEISFDFFPYERTGSDLFMLLPSWLRKKDKGEILEILRSPERMERKETINYLKSLTLHYDRIIIASSFSNLGKTISEISEISGLTPEETILNLLLANNLHVSIFSDVISPDHIKKLAQEKNSVIASDGVGYDSDHLNDLPHPRSFGAFPRALKIFVKEEKVLDWKTAIYKMTGLPAQILGINNRGGIAKKFKADIIIFDPEQISDYATYNNPFQYSQGINYVIINGKLVLNNGHLTGEMPGQILRKK